MTDKEILIQMALGTFDLKELGHISHASTNPKVLSAAVDFYIGVYDNCVTYIVGKDIFYNTDLGIHITPEYFRGVYGHFVRNLHLDTQDLIRLRNRFGEFRIKYD